MSVRYALACRDSAKVVSQANQRQAKEALAKIPQTAVCGYFKSNIQTRNALLFLIPQTAVCGYFKSSLLGQANPMANVVPEPTLFREGWT